MQDLRQDKSPFSAQLGLNSMSIFNSHSQQVMALSRRACAVSESLERVRRRLRLQALAVGICGGKTLTPGRLREKAIEVGFLMLDLIIQVSSPGIQRHCLGSEPCLYLCLCPSVFLAELRQTSEISL